MGLKNLSKSLVTSLVKMDEVGKCSREREPNQHRQISQPGHQHKPEPNDWQEKDQELEGGKQHTMELTLASDVSPTS